MSLHKIGIQFKSSLGGTIESMNSTSASLNNVNRNAKAVSKTFSGFYAVNRKVNNSFSNMTKDANRAGNSIANVGGKMFNLSRIVQGLSLYKIGFEMAKATQSNIDMVESINLFNVAMGEYAIQTNKAVESMSTLLGMDTTNLQNRVGTYNLLARSMGMAGDQSAKLSENTNRLALDLASLTNIPINQVAQDLRSGLVGQSETMYKYGVDVTEASLKVEALNQGITTSVRQMSQGEKMALRYAVMLRQTSLAHGDFARNIETPANQLKILSERMVTLSRAIGSLFIPMLATALPYLNAIVIVLTRIINTIAKLIGYKPMETVKNVANGFGGISVGADDATDAIGGTAKALKKLQALAGFDEINVLATKSPDTGAGTGGGVDGGTGAFDVDLPEYDSMFDQVRDRAMELADEIQPKLEFILKLVGAIGVAFLAWKVGSALHTGFVVLMTVLGQLKALMDLIMTHGLFATISGLYPKLLPIITGILGVVAILGGLYLAFEGIKAILTDSETSWKSYAQAIGGVLLVAGGVFLLFGGLPALIAGVVGGLVVLGASLYANSEGFREFVDNTWDKIKIGMSNIGEFLATAWDEVLVVLKGVAEFLGGIFLQAWEILKVALQFIWQSVIKPFGETLIWFWKQVVVPLAGIIKDVLVLSFNNLKDVLTILWNNILKPLSSFIGTVFTSMLKGVHDVVVTLLGKAFTPLNQYLDGTMKGTIEALSKVVQFLWQNVFKPLAEYLSSGFISTFKSVTGDIKVQIEALERIFKGLMSFITGVFTGDWKRAWEGVKDLFGGIFDSLVGLVKVPLNKVIDAINGVISGINDKLSFRIPSWVPDYGGKSFGLNLKNIPKLARGGQLSTGQLFEAGENGKAELIGQYNGKTTVMPLEDSGFVQAVRDAVLEGVISGMGGSGSNQPIIVQVGNERLVDTVVSGINRKSAINGATVIRV